MSHELESDLGFSPAEIAECLAREGLLSLELEFTKKCNLRCVYCYSAAGEALEGELSLEEILSVIEQARGLGARKVVLLGGGEPFLFPHVAEIVRHIHSVGLSQAVFTNGMLLDEPLCRLLFECGVTVAIKHNSFRPEVQDDLAGVAGAHRLIQRGMRLLMDAGYPAEGRSLCVQSDHLPPEPGRDRDAVGLGPGARVYPVCRSADQSGAGARASGSPPVPPGTPYDLPPVGGDRPGTVRRAMGPTAAHRRIHLPPPSVQLSGQFAGLRAAVHRRGSPVGNIREKPLADILRSSTAIRELRGIYRRIDPACRVCEFAGECYGCRGSAFQATGDYLAADPDCWVTPRPGRETCA